MAEKSILENVMLVSVSGSRQHDGKKYYPKARFCSVEPWVTRNASRDVNIKDDQVAKLQTGIGKLFNLVLKVYEQDGKDGKWFSYSLDEIQPVQSVVKAA